LKDLLDSLSFIESFFKYFEDEAPSPYLFWAIIIIVAIAIELMIGDLLFASISFASLMALLSQIIGFDYIGQILTFGISSILLLIILRPLALKHLSKNTKDNVTNVDALIGALATTIQSVDEHTGMVKLKGENWSARTEIGAESIESDSYVRVIRIDGATVIVSKYNNKKNESAI